MNRETEIRLFGGDYSPAYGSTQTDSQEKKNIVHYFDIICQQKADIDEDTARRVQIRKRKNERHDTKNETTCHTQQSFKNHYFQPSQYLTFNVHHEPFQALVHQHPSGNYGSYCLRCHHGGLASSANRNPRGGVCDCFE